VSEGYVPVLVMVFTLNDAIHLPSCLAALAWCDDVNVVDSFSSDTTESLCFEAGARFFQNRFTGFGDQRASPSDKRRKTKLPTHRSASYYEFVVYRVTDI